MTTKLATWIRPPDDQLPDAERIWPWVNRRRTLAAKPYRRVVLVSSVVGMSHPSACDFRMDWRLRPGHDRSGYHRRKLQRLLRGFRNPSTGRRVPPLTQKLLLDPRFSRATTLVFVGGAYFVENNLHRVAAAHILDRKKLLAEIRPWILRKGAPKDLCQWLIELRVGGRRSGLGHSGRGSSKCGYN